MSFTSRQDVWPRNLTKQPFPNDNHLIRDIMVHVICRPLGVPAEKRQWTDCTSYIQRSNIGTRLAGVKSIGNSRSVGDIVDRGAYYFPCVSSVNRNSLRVMTRCLCGTPSTPVFPEIESDGTPGESSRALICSANSGSRATLNDTYLEY